MFKFVWAKGFSLTKMSGHRRVLCLERESAEVVWPTLSVRACEIQARRWQLASGHLQGERPEDLLDFLNALRCDAKSLGKVRQLAAGQCCPGASGAFRQYSCACNICIDLLETL